MGHKIGYRHRPRYGSLGYWPRKRAKRQYPRMNWKDGNGVLGFPGYKAGMTHVMVIDNRKNSLTKGKKISMPVTIIETPAVKVIGLRFYKKTFYGTKSVGNVMIKDLDKDAKRKLIQPKKEPKKFDDIKDYTDVRLIVQTQPRLIDLKKTPEVFEIGLGGDINKRVELAKNYLGKEMRINDALKEGMQVDACAITTGKGFQGSVKRHGIKVRSHKTFGHKRTAGTHAPHKPRTTSWRVPQYGQLGYHTRTEPNKLILKISDKPEEVNPKGGLINYGLVKKDYVMLKGSLPGPKKRMICLRQALRPNKTVPKVPPQINYISLTSKQGVRL